MILVSGTAFGLGLGEISVKSRLNQPFRAGIDLLSVRGSEMDSITVRLASSEEFASAGIDLAYVLRQLQFELAQKNDGTPYIKVSSAQALKEPFLDFLIEVNWANGRLLKEYTVLLDPPVFAAPSRKVVPVVPPRSTAAVPEAPKVSAAAPVMQPAETTAPVTKAPAAEEELFPQFDIGMQETAAPADTAAAPAWSGDSYGPTTSGDTLWSIAERVRPDDSVSVQQMMLALLNANPEAFNDKNINALRKGHVLRVPEKDAAMSMTAAEALQEVKMQYARWGQAAPAPASQPGPAASESTPEEKTEEKPEAAAPAETREAQPDEAAKPEVKLVTPSKPGTGESGTGTEGLQAKVDSMQKELLLTKEALSTAEGENTDLKTRLTEVEEQVASQQRMLTLKDDELAKLQQQLDSLRDETQRAVETAPAEPEAKPEMAAAAKPEATEPVAAKPEAAKPVEEPKAAAKPAPAKPVTRPVPPSKQSGFLDDMLSSPLMLGVVVVVLLGLLGGAYIFWQRRRVSEYDFTESILHDSSAGTAAGEGGDTLLSSFAASSLATETTGAGETDPLAEADVFIAYKRYSQAEEMLNAALEEDPDRPELKLKLMEVHYATENTDKFEQLAGELHEALGGERSDLWEKAELMGKELCPDSPLFAAAEAAAGEPVAAAAEPQAVEPEAAETMEDLGLDLDFDLPEDLMEAESILSEVEEAAAAIEAGETETATEEPGLDLDFETLGAAEEPAPAEPEPAAEAAPELELEMEFDLGELGAETTAAPAEEEPAAVTSVDEVATKLDLARAYIDMGDPEGARNILEEVAAEGSDAQKQEAEELIAKL
jgi:pilus assembly protein FimV